MAHGTDLIIDIREKRFPTLPTALLENFQLQVPASQILVILGPSGIGKSSLLRMIAGIDNSYDGTITLGGVPARNAPPSGFVFQDPRLLPWLTAIDNIRAARPETTREEAQRLLGRVGLGAYGDSFPHQLSGGMQRRVGLARALSVDPRLLLLDEPFVSLDRLLITELQTLFLEIADQENATVILVSHHAEDAARMGDRVIVLEGRPARIVRDAPILPPRHERSREDILRIAEELAAYSVPVTA